MILLLASALAGWLPPETLEEPLVAQSAGRRLLLQSEGDVVAWEGPLRLTLALGPEGALVVPAPRAGRDVRIEAQGEVTVWRESLSLDAPAWDRWERELAEWQSGPMPEPPAELGGQLLEWEARRALLDADLWMGLALLETESVRARSQTDHPATVLEGEPWTLEGPGVLVVDHRVLLDEPVQQYQVALLLDREPTWSDWVTSENPEDPGMGWARRSELVIPPGEHEVRVAVEGAAVTLDATWRPLRPSFKSRGALRSLTAEHQGVAAMEQANALGTPVVELARELLGTQADELARARIIEHTVSVDEALGLFKPTPLLVWALAQRWRRHADVSAYVFVELAELLPDDPELLAELAEALRRPELRPRGEAIRWLAEVDSRGRPGSRWTGLPSTCEVTLIPVGPGRAFTRLGAGQSVRIELEDGLGYPILRMRGHARYLIDGVEHRGSGDLSVALTPGSHGVEVLEGELLLPDGLGGEQVFERRLCDGDSAWAMPEPGAPVRVSLTIVGQGDHVIAADDGQTWFVRTSEPITNVELWAGAKAAELSVRGEGQYAAAMRRRVDGEPVELPVLEGDPLVHLQIASRALVEAEAVPGPLVAGLRLERAAAYKALGLTGSARKEADLVARMPEATDLQRERARALFPRPTHSIQPGPVTAEGALAEGLKLPPEGDGSDWEAAASGLDHPSEVLKHASALYLADGDLPAAFRTAAGSEDDGAIRRVSFHGTWEPLVRVEQGNGVRTLVLDRQGPVAADGPHAQAREVSLGYPWEPSQVLVVREGRRDRLDFVGRKLELDLLCRDELFDRAPAPCEVLVRVDGEETTVSLDDTGRHTLIRELRHGTHRVEVELTGPSALVVHAVVDEDLFAPQLPVTTHATPITTTVAGPSLVRVRVHEGAVRVTVGDRTEVQVTDYVVLPAEGAALVRIESEGTKPALVTLARLRWDEAELEPEPDPWRWVAPPARGQAAKATEHWMALSAQTEGTVGTAPGQQGTLIGRARAGQDPGYRYGSAEAIWLRSLGAQRWIDLSATGRASPDGAPSAGAEFRGTWIPSPWVLSFDAEAFTSGGGGHALAFAQGRYRIDLAPWWRLQPYLGAHAGVYSGRPDRMVDPLAWDPRDDAHPFGLHFGTHLDWRRYRDARVRLTLRAVTEPGPSLDRVGATLLADVLAREMLVVRLEGGVNHSFPQTVPYGAGTVRWSPWGDDAGRRYVVEGRVRASPVDGVTGYVGLAIEASEDRGVLDHSRLDRVFLGALEYPVEER